MKEELRKSLTDLIDETLNELEELKKSRFSAAEIDIKGPGEGIAGKPSDGDLHAKKAEDKKDDEEDEKEEAEKAEGKNRESDPDGGHHKMDKGEMQAGPSDGSSHGSAAGHNRQADPDGGHHKMDKAEDKEDKKKDKDAKGGEEHEKEERKAIGKLSELAGMKKSLEESEALLKSFVEERVRPLEDKLSTILDLVNKIADQPVAPKGLTGRAVPLMKSADDAGEPLSKSEVASKLFELKKSGTKVDSLDITRAEMGQDLHKIVEKYKIS
jgi:hypothetical protein